MAIQSWAVMAVDPGETCGFALMHVYPESSKHQHPIVRWTAWQEPVPADPPDNKIEAGYFVDRAFMVDDPYKKYRAMTEKIAQYWMDFRRWSCAPQGYGIAKSRTFLVLEDWLLPPEIKTRKRETLSPVYLNMMLYGYLWGMAGAYEDANFGPAHVGAISFITPSERGERDLFTNAMLERAQLLVKPRTKYDHANQATRVGLAFLRKKPNVPDLTKEFKGERPPPRREVWRPSEYSGPFQLSGHEAYEPGDPTPQMPRRKKARARAGFDVSHEPIYSLKEDLRTQPATTLRSFPAAVEYIATCEKMRRVELLRLLKPEATKWMWTRFSNPEAGWATPATRGSLAPTKRLRNLARALLAET